MKDRGVKDALRREIDKIPGVQASFSRRKKHEQVVLSYDGRSRFVVYPTTAGDGRRALKNILRDVRAELRNLGVFPSELAV